MKIEDTDISEPPKSSRLPTFVIMDEEEESSTGKEKPPGLFNINGSKITH